MSELISLRVSDVNLRMEYLTCSDGHKERIIPFGMIGKDISGRIVTIEYDPNRNAYICLIHYGDGEKRYILHPRGAIIGDSILSGTEVSIKMGNALRLGNALPLSAV